MPTVLRTAYGLFALVIFLLVALLTALPLAVLPRERQRRHAGQRAMRCALMLIGVRIRTDDLDRLPTSPAICVCNHSSQLDGLILFALLPSRYTFVVRAESRRTPLFGFMLERVGVIWMDRADARSGSRTIRVLMRQLAAGRSVAMFPEGTIRPEPGLLPFKIGAYLLACKAQVPLVPLVMRGTRTLFPDRAKLPAHSHIDVSALPPLHAEGRTREDARRLLDTSRRLILERCGEPDTAAA